MEVNFSKLYILGPPVVPSSTVSLLGRVPLLE